MSLLNLWIIPVNPRFSRFSRDHLIWMFEIMAVMNTAKGIGYNGRDAGIFTTSSTRPLDVYKRQTLICSCSKLIFSTGFLILPLWKFSCLFQSSCRVYHIFFLIQFNEIIRRKSGIFTVLHYFQKLTAACQSIRFNNRTTAAAHRTRRFLHREITFTQRKPF